jgi:hypothetical protein
MTFIQIIEYETNREQEMEALFAAWLKATDGRRTASHSLHTRDRERPARFVDIVEFPSYEEAMANSKLPATQQVAEQLRQLCTGGPLFLNLDVLRDERI